jgi:hypothetical protein
MMKTLYLKYAPLFAAGLLAAALAAPMAASAALPIVPSVAGLIGGNRGGLPVLELPTVRVKSPAELLLTLFNQDFKGRVIIPADAQWDLSGYISIPLRSGVSLIGERGPLGSRPLLFTTYKAEAYPFFVISHQDKIRNTDEIFGNDVRVEGIHF